MCLPKDNEKIYPAVPAQLFKAGVDRKGKSYKTIASLRAKGSNLRLSHSLVLTPLLLQGGSKVRQCDA